MLGFDLNFEDFLPRPTAQMPGNDGYIPLEATGEKNCTFVEESKSSTGRVGGEWFSRIF